MTDTSVYVVPYIGLAASKGSLFLRAVNWNLFSITILTLRHNFSLLVVNSEHVHEQSRDKATTEIVKCVILNGETQCCISPCNNVSYNENVVNEI